MNICDCLSDSDMVKLTKKSKNLFIKKRTHQWENEVHKNDLQAQNALVFGSFGDRFIPKRFQRSNLERNIKFLYRKEVKDILKMNLKPDYWRQNCFVSAMNYTFGVSPRSLLEYGGSMQSGEQQALNPIVLHLDTDWACKPRTKPIAFMDASHDLPEFSEFFDYNLMDWSIKDQIAVSFGQNIIIWNSRADTTMVFSLKCPTALAYSPNGKYLAISSIDLDFPFVELWEVNQFYNFYVTSFKYLNKLFKSVSCIEWSNYGNEIICGTSSGSIFVLLVPYLESKHCIQNNNVSITIMRFSPTMRFLAVGDIQGNITIYKWPTLQVYLHVRSKLNLRVTFDWHPWNGLDLAISENLPASIIILHVPSKEIVAFYQRCDKKVQIHSVNFSKITGELLVSISKRDSEGCVRSLILVMASLSRIVDIMDIPESGARFMMWGPDGTTLTTGGSDETLTVWNFCPKQKKKNETKSIYLKKITFNSELTRWWCLK